MAAVCTGSLLLGRAGHVAGLRATTHHLHYERLTPDRRPRQRWGPARRRAALPGRPRPPLAPAGRDPIPDCPGLGQPEHQVLAGHPCFLSAHGGRLQLSLSDLANPYEVTESVVEAARHIEPLLAELTARVIDPPLDNYHCLCPKYHPDLWP